MRSQNTFGPLDEAEQTLFPGIPYDRLTIEQREATYVRAKEIVFQRTGKKIP